MHASALNALFGSAARVGTCARLGHHIRGSLLACLSGAVRWSLATDCLMRETTRFFICFLNRSVCCSCYGIARKCECSWLVLADLGAPAPARVAVDFSKAKHATWLGGGPVLVWRARLLRTSCAEKKEQSVCHAARRRKTMCRFVVGAPRWPETRPLLFPAVQRCHSVLLSGDARLHGILGNK